MSAKFIDEVHLMNLGVSSWDRHVHQAKQLPINKGENNSLNYYLPKIHF